MGRWGNNTKSSTLLLILTDSYFFLSNVFFLSSQKWLSQNRVFNYETFKMLVLPLAGTNPICWAWAKEIAFTGLCGSAPTILTFEGAVWEVPSCKDTCLQPEHSFTDWYQYLTARGDDSKIARRQAVRIDDLHLLGVLCVDDPKWKMGGS